MSFHDVRFPTDISLGASGGPVRRTQVVVTASGAERRNGLWLQARRSWDAGYGVRTLDDLYTVIAFFEARLGRLHGFRWKDGADFRSGAPLQPVSALDVEIGTGDGTTTQFQLVKRYASGGVEHVRPVTKPVAGTVVAALDGVALDPSEFSADPLTGTVTFAAAPAAGVSITAGYEFDVAVRFDTDRLDINLSHFEAGQIPSIPVIELKDG
ncbi:MAG: TIGR02217 family protein [Alphaproteobacteria bacterium]